MRKYFVTESQTFQTSGTVVPKSSLESSLSFWSTSFVPLPDTDFHAPKAKQTNSKKAKARPKTIRGRVEPRRGR